FFFTLQQLKFNPKHIMDIGANHGGWTKEALKIFPEAQYTLLEPQSQLKNSINNLLENKKNVQIYSIGAGKENGSFKFTIVDREDSCSFKYSEEEAKEKGFSQ